jgi:hypothetical protein
MALSGFIFEFLSVSGFTGFSLFVVCYFGIVVVAFALGIFLLS